VAQGGVIDVVAFDNYWVGIALMATEEMRTEQIGGVASTSTKFEVSGGLDKAGAVAACAG
jgi:hypothetical protein